MGAAVTMATVAAWRKSAVSKPVKVAPTIVPLASSTTRREVPPVSLPWKLAPGVPSVGASTARASMPAACACASVLPAAATCGSGEGTRGGASARGAAHPPRLRLCERFAGGGDLRVGEGDAGGAEAFGDRLRRAPEQVLGGDPGVVLAHVGEERAAVGVADRVEPVAAADPH